MKRIKLSLASEPGLTGGLQLGNNEKEIKAEVKAAAEEVTKKVVVETYANHEGVKQEEEVTLPKSVIEGLIALAGKKPGALGGGDNEAINAIRELTNAYKDSQATDNRFLGQRAIDITEIDQDDVLDVPAFFFSHCVSYTIWDDRKNGRTISTPYKRALKFVKVQRTVTMNAGSKIPSYLSISSIIVRSKKEAEFIRNHSHFGIKFFENIAGAKSMSAEMQEKLVTAFNMVSSFDDHTVAQRCTREGISIDSMDFAALRRKL